MAETNGLVRDPFRYLLAYSMKAGLGSPSLREYEPSCRLNLSALSDDEFYDVVCTENIKRRRLYSDAFSLPEASAYLKELKEQLRSCRKAVVFGRRVMDLIFSEALSVPPAMLVAWVNPEQPEVSSYRYFYNNKQLSIEELQGGDYDAILSLEPRREATAEKLAACGLGVARRVIHVLPDGSSEALAELFS